MHTTVTDLLGMLLHITEINAVSEEETKKGNAAITRRLSLHKALKGDTSMKQIHRQCSMLHF
jgi:hypothetical protein